MARGIDHQPIFRDDHDRDDLLDRIASLVAEQAWTVHAWALMPDHFHLLIRTGQRTLARSMRSLLGGYAGRFNRRHRRNGHLFQNRFKSILCEEESYFLTLVRYIHRNPLRSGIVQDLAALDEYPYTGHSSLVGRARRSWQAGDLVLARFAFHPDPVAGYRDFIATEGERDEARIADGIGIGESAGRVRVIDRLKRGREAYRDSERILGSDAFLVEKIRELESSRTLRPAARPSLAELIQIVCGALGISSVLPLGRGRGRLMSRAREGLAFLWIEHFGGRAAELAAALDVDSSPLYRAAKRGRRHAERWKALGTLRLK
jgi:REP element-mobilizing transposase RayT